MHNPVKLADRFGDILQRNHSHTDNTVGKAGDIIRDVAALNKVEMLQWDTWGAMPRPNNTMQDKKRLEFFDKLAALTHNPDDNFEQLQKFYRDEANRLLVGERVFNAMRRHLERV